MTFALKKIISPLLYPTGLSLLLLSLGIFLLLFSDRRRRGLVLAFTGFFVLLLFSNPPVSNWLVSSLERRYPVLSLDELDRIDKREEGSIDYLVVLGGGQIGSQGGAVSKLSTSSLRRTVESVQIAKKLSGLKVIFSGGDIFTNTSQAELMGNVALSMGVSEDRIIREEESLDTRDQAVRLKKILGDNKFFLVTSAIHMPRAAALFKAEGLNIIPVSVGQLAGPVSKNISAMVFPSVHALSCSSAAVHEYYGLLWSYLMGQIPG